MSTGKILIFCTKCAHFFCEVGTDSNIYLGEMLLHEIHILNLEAFSVQVVKTACIGSETKCQFIGV